MYRKIRNSSNRFRQCSLLFLTFLFCILNDTSLNAQNINSISLTDALKIAKENNRTILKSRIEEKISEENTKQAKQQRYPEVDLHGAYSKITNLTEFKNGFLQGAAVTKTIPEIYDISSSFRMPVYEGDKINTLIKKAKQENEISRLNIEKNENDIQLEVVAAFLEIYEMQELQKIINESIKEEQERLKEVKAFKAHGTVTKNEVLRAELQLADRELNALTNAKNIKIAYHNLKTLLQLPEEEELLLDTSAIFENQTKLPDYNFYLEKTMNNEEMRIAGQELEIRKSELQLTKANYYPKISFFGNYNLRYPNYMFFPPSPYLYSLGQIGVEMTFSLSNLYKNKSRVQAANLKVAAQQTEAEIIKDKMKDKIFANYIQYEEVLDKVPVTEKSLDLATENYRIVKMKYLNQLVLITEMVDADNALLQAKFNKIAVKIDEIMKRYTLLHTAGILNQ